MTGRVPGWLPPVGVLVGAAIAFVGLLTSDGAGAGLPDGAVARVGERLITRAELDRALTRVVADRRSDVADATLRRRVLERLVDEALLVEYGEATGLYATDPALKTQLGGAVIDRIVAEAADALDPDEATLRAHYDAHAPRFATTARLHVRRLAFDEASAASAAVQASRAGAAWASLEAGASPAVAPPDGLVPPEKLRDYLGPTLTEAALELPIGVVSGPFAAGGAHHVLLPVAREPGEARPFDAVRALVAVDHRRAAGDAALRRFLTARREAVGVTLTEAP